MRRPLVAAAVGVVVVALLVLGVFGGGLGLVRQGLAATGVVPDPAETVSPPELGVSSSARASSATSAPVPASTPSPTPAGLPPAVLAAATPQADTVAAQVRKRLAAVPTKDVAGKISAEVVDVASGKVLYHQQSGTDLTPASTLKLLTSAAALRLLGPEHRFTTRVVQPSPGTVILVGGGDPYLAKKADPHHVRGSIADLAVATAATLRKQGRTSIKLGYDASLFDGPAWNPNWPAGYSDQVTPTSALWVDEGRLAGGSPGPRSKAPALAAADAFASVLKTNGIRVTSRSRESEPAPAGAPSIAAVASMPLEQIVEHLLMTSDNDAAETLLRQAGVAASHDGSIKAGVKAVKHELTELGLWDSGTVTYDGSGLARENKVPADLMAELLRTAATGDHPELRALITGLPVAGVEGSLRHRYGDDDTEFARGLVRGKTGTLRQVHSLAGFVRTSDGSMLTYAFLVNDPPNDYAAVVWLEKVTAALAACGCR